MKGYRALTDDEVARVSQGVLWHLRGAGSGAVSAGRENWLPHE
jgi:hypothetical protein